MVPLSGFDFGALDDPAFGEAAVREEIVAPILRALGYQASGPNQAIRNHPLTHPYVSIGVKKHNIRIVPDYLMTVDGQRTWVLDAKAPWESIDDPDHQAQVYSYAIHRDVRVDWYAICNGHELALFHVGDMSDQARLRVDLKAIGECWGEMYVALKPHGRISDRGTLDKDYGILLHRLGWSNDTRVCFPGVPLLDPMVTRLSGTGPYRMPSALRTEDQRYAVSFDFDPDVFLAFMKLLPAGLATGVAARLGEGPHVQLHVVGDLGRFNLETHLGDFEENDREHYIPLKVTRIWR